MVRQGKNNRLGPEAFGTPAANTGIFRSSKPMGRAARKARRPLDHFEPIDRQVIRLSVETKRLLADKGHDADRGRKA